MFYRKEINAIRYASYVRGILLSFIMFTSRVSIFGSLAMYVILGSQIDAQKAFAVTAFYNILRLSMTNLFPQGIYQFAETIVSVRRIQKFLLYEELPRSKEQLERVELNKKNIVEDKVDVEDGLELKTNKNGYKNLHQPMMIIEDATAKWDEKVPEETLSKINVQIQPGELVAVIGPVGSGKSSLIQAILGELLLKSGSITVNGEISYASQEPWLFSASIRQNILFGLPMDRDRYKEVVKVCALERDFSLFPQHDKTVVGERGASLSGGQKARINLARAVYRRADIYLLDDPLSAVDSHVGSHLFDECIKSYLRGSVTILITHQVQYLQEADQIILMNHGKVAAIGTYDSLSMSGLDFTQLLSHSENQGHDDNASMGSEDQGSSQSLNRNLQKQISRTSRRSSISSLTSDMSEAVAEEKRDTGSIGFSVR